MLSYHHLIAGGKALLLLSSPVVAVSPSLVLPLPPCLRHLPIMTSADDVWCPQPSILHATTSPCLLCWTWPALQPWPLSQHKDCFQLYCFGTCGAPAGQGFDLWPQHPSTLLLSWQWEWKVLWWDSFCMPGRRGPPSWRSHCPYTALPIRVHAGTIKLMLVLFG
jgi:hypothetical protein